MSQAIHFKHICFTGLHKEPASLEFMQGVNLLYGASDTGKSFVLGAIVYMLGGNILKNIPERVGYDNIFLAVETSSGEQFTLRRSTEGGNYHLYQGLHKKIPEGIEPEVVYQMSVQKLPEGGKKISEFILNKVGLSGKKLKKNQRYETVNLNLSHIFNLCFVDEETIYRQSSVIDRDDTILNTQDHSLFKLLLTGVDDGALVADIPRKDRQLSKNAKLEVIDTLIENNNQRISEYNVSYEDALDQFKNIQASINREQELLAASESEYKELIKTRNLLRYEENTKIERRHEIDGIIRRFQLLDDHYQSDLERLDSICEAGAFMCLLPDAQCPHCGASPAAQNHSINCSVNIVPTVEAAIAEKNKIIRLKSELIQTIDDLHSESLYVENIIPGINRRLKTLEGKIEEISPLIKSSSATYSELLEKRTLLKEIISAYEQISGLADMKKEVEAEARPKGSAGQAAESSLPQSLLNDLAKHIESVLKAWEFPDSERVFFDTEANDLTINGKRRKDRGKGMRSVIHAAFNIGLLEFCQKHKLPHLGVVVLDSPLLAYREPDDDMDSLRETSVQDKFYEYLLNIKDRQVIIIENVNPPDFMTGKPYTTHFSGNANVGRFGFFPPSNQ